MKYKKYLMLLIICTGVVLTGCSGGGDTIGLNQEPGISNVKQVEIKKTLDKILPPGAEYMTPKKAEQKQSIFIEDINGYGKKEAFALYRDMRGNQQVHLLVLQEDKGKWDKVSDVATSGNIIDYFSIKDLNGDGNKEVIAGIGVSETNKQLFIYEWRENSLVKKQERTYEAVDIADYNEDGKPDIIILHGEIRKSRIAEMFSYNKGELKSISKVKIDTDGYHENIVSGKLADGEKALFIDSGLGAHSMLTEIVAFDKGKLIKVGDEKDGILLKAYPLYSKDINKDGVTEVGGMYIPKGYEEEALAEIPFIYAYVDYQLDGTKKTIEERYSDNGQHFYIKIPDKWYGKVTIKTIDKGVRLVSNTDQKILFEVKWVNKELYINFKTKLGETKNTVFYTEIDEF